MLLALVASARAQLLGFVQSDEAQFLASYTELTADSYSAPLLRSVVNNLLPPNTALLAQCREQAAQMMSASFRATFMHFRSRLYQLLASLPSSALSAKLLNVVMPMVVADIVDPSNNPAVTSAAFAAMLSPDDAALGTGGEDARGGFDSIHIIALRRPQDGARPERPIHENANASVHDAARMGESEENRSFSSSSTSDRPNESSETHP